MMAADVVVVLKIEEKMAAHRRLSHGTPGSGSLQVSPLNDRMTPHVSPLILPREAQQLSDDLSALHLAPDEESELKVESHIADAERQCHIFLPRF